MIGQNEIQERLTLFSKVNSVAVAFQNANKKNSTMAAIDFRDPEILSFFKSMETEKVEYLLIGGFAMAFHGYVRATHDLDIWLKDSSENIARFITVLKKAWCEGTG